MPPTFLEPPVELAAPENQPFQHIDGLANQLEWLAHIALGSSSPLPTPPSSGTTSPQHPASTLVTNKSKLVRRTTLRAAGPSFPALRVSLPGRPNRGDGRFSSWRYDSSKLCLGMAESISDTPAPMKLQKRSIGIPAASGPAYYYVWDVRDQDMDGQS